MSEDTNMDRIEVMHSCCCCLLRPSEKDLKSPYTHYDKIEIYSDMIKECFQIKFSVSNGCGICEVCVGRLRDACDFKLQVQRSQAELMVKIMHDADDQVEVKLEKPDDESDEYSTKYELVTVKVESLDEEINVNDLKPDKELRVKLENDGEHPMNFENSNDEISIEFLAPASCSGDPTERDTYSCDTSAHTDKHRSTHHIQKNKTDSCEGSSQRLSTNQEIDILKRNRELLKSKLLHKRVHTVDKNSYLLVTDKPYFCVVCKKGFTDKSALNTHLLIHTQKPFSRQKYNQQFTQTLTKNIPNGKPFPCDSCEMRFMTKTQLISHLKVHTGQKPYPCDECNKTFAHATSLTSHKNIHMGDSPFTCGECDKRFISNAMLKRHIGTHNGEKHFKCDDCNKLFTQKCSLKRHKLLHAGDINTCDVCGKQFALKMYLIEHIRMHTEEQLYPCDVCSKKFTSDRKLKKHKNVHVHMEDRPFACSECDKRFMYSHQLNIHSASHTGEKRFSCEQCQKSFTFHSTLIRHRRLHKGEKPVKTHTRKKH